MSTADIGEGDSGKRLFCPPLYLQRYDAVIGAMVNNKDPIKSVADLGCAEGGILRYYKSIAHLEKLIAVDLDDIALNYANRKVEPIVADYIMGRSVQLDVYLYKGDICVPDSRLIGIDAISCVEVIEHMAEDKVYQLSDCIFGIYKPKLVAITTPNIEFNVIFGNKTPKFRHYDHKFEWTRSQFTEFCNKIITQYPEYRYEITGVGLPTKEHPNVGYASQIAYFRLNSMKSPSHTNTSTITYSRIESPDNSNGITQTIKDDYQLLWHHVFEQKVQPKFTPIDWNF